MQTAVDGDGEYEIIVKWDPSNAQDNSNDGYTGNVYIDAYKLDGTRLWRIDLGRNIRAGAHYTQFIVYDLDGDGISGKVSMVPNVRTGELSIGRFGHRASNPTVEQQSAGAFFNDMRLSSTLFPNPDGGVEISDEDIDLITIYQKIAGVPFAINQDDPRVIAGKLKFQEVGKGLTLSNHMAFPAVFVVSQVTWDAMSDTEKAALVEVAEEALAWGTAQQIEAEEANIATLEAEIEVGRIENAKETFATANRAFQDRFGGDPIVARFQEQVAAGEVGQ